MHLGLSFRQRVKLVEVDSLLFRLDELQDRISVDRLKLDEPKRFNLHVSVDIVCSKFESNRYRLWSSDSLKLWLFVT